MAPIIEVSDEVLSGLDKLKIPYSRKTQINLDNDYVFVPSLNLYVAKERILKRKNWFDAHNELQAENLRMLTIPEFIEFLKYAKSNPDLQNLYDEITQVRNPWRAEWLDADFKVKYNKKLYINSRHLVDAHGNLIPQYSEPLDENTLMDDRIPGISLDSWLEKPTPQGLPSKKTKSGDLYYLYPRSDNNSVARFSAVSDGSDLSCCRYPSNRVDDLGVRAVKRA